MVAVKVFSVCCAVSASAIRVETEVNPTVAGMVTYKGKTFEGGKPRRRSSQQNKQNLCHEAPHHSAQPVDEEPFVQQPQTEQPAQKIKDIKDFEYNNPMLKPEQSKFQALSQRFWNLLGVKTAQEKEEAKLEAEKEEKRLAEEKAQEKAQQEHAAAVKMQSKIRQRLVQKEAEEERLAQKGADRVKRRAAKLQPTARIQQITKILRGLKSKLLSHPPMAVLEKSVDNFATGLMHAKPVNDETDGYNADRQGKIGEMLRMDDQDFKKLYWDGTSQMTYEDRKGQKFVQRRVDYRVMLKLFENFDFEEESAYKSIQNRLAEHKNQNLKNIARDYHELAVDVLPKFRAAIDEKNWKSGQPWKYTFDECVKIQKMRETYQIRKGLRHPNQQKV